MPRYTAEEALEIVRRNGLALSRIPVDERTPDLCLAAIRQNSRSSIYVPEAARSHEIMRLARLADSHMAAFA